jgi:hypothetical protein
MILLGKVNFIIAFIRDLELFLPSVLPFIKKLICQKWAFDLKRQKLAVLSDVYYFREV